ncbi:hypothetical protein [Tychonema sp. LEGE 06208]|nr:hypothetical protein [Tychonema sp. LEGE 06208]
MAASGGGGETGRVGDCGRVGEWGSKKLRSQLAVEVCQTFL